MARKVAKKKVTKKKVAAPKKATKKATKKPAKKKVAKKQVTKATDEDKPVKKKKATRRKKKTPEEIRLKATWGVFSQTLKQVASFEYHQKKQALDKSATLSKAGKPPHFVRIVKEPIEEEV
ncbi:MAG: hypothetical protein ABGX05_01745 [Pirellulaceae bacterium]